MNKQDKAPTSDSYLENLQLELVMNLENLQREYYMNRERLLLEYKSQVEQYQRSKTAQK